MTESSPVPPGATAPGGAYTLALAATDSAGNAVPVKISSTGTVTEVRSQDGAVELGVNGIAIPVKSLIGIGS